MKKFKDVRTGVISVVTNEKLFEQYENHSDIYVLVDDAKTEGTNEPTLKDLKARADELSIQYRAKATKTELIELIENANAE